MESARGWVDQDRLLRMLRMDENLLYTHVHRARQHLAKAGVHGAARLVDRRRDSKQLRFGSDRVQVERI